MRGQASPMHKQTVQCTNQRLLLRMRLTSVQLKSLPQLRNVCCFREEPLHIAANPTQPSPHPTSPCHPNVVSCQQMPGTAHCAAHHPMCASPVHQSQYSSSRGISSQMSSSSVLESEHGPISMVSSLSLGLVGSEIFVKHLRRIRFIAPSRGPSSTLTLAYPDPGWRLMTNMAIPFIFI